MAKRDITIRRRKSASSKAHIADSGSEAEELSVVPERRKRRRHFTFLRALIRLFFVAALIAGGFYIWQNWDVLAPESAVIWLNDKLAGGQQGDGFPVEITGSTVLDMTQMQDGLSLLTDSSLVVFNSKGGEILRRQHGFSKPILRTAGKWMLVADTGGNRLRLDSRASTAVDMTITNHIISAAVNGNGDFALATDSSQGATSEVVVYDRHQEVIYHWKSAELTVLDVALSPDGKSMAVVGVMADGGAMKCLMQLFDFDKDQPVAQYEDTDLMLFAVDYFPNGTVAAVGDRALWVFNESGSIKQKQSFDDHSLVGYRFGDSAVSAVLHNYGSSEGGTLLTVNPSGDKAYTVPFEGSFRSLAPYGSGMLLLTSEHLYRTNASGKQYTGDVVRDGRMVSSLGNKAIVLGLTSLSESEIPSS